MADRYSPNRRRQPLSERESDILEQEIGRSLAEIDARTGRAVQYAPLSEQDIASGIISREAPRRGAASISEMIESPTALEPRFIPGARVERPDDPRLLEQELLDPVLSAFGMDGVSSGRPSSTPRQPAPKTYKFNTADGGQKVVMFDPITGEGREIHSEAGRTTTPRMTEEKRSAIRVAEKELADARAAVDKIPNDKKNLDARAEALQRWRKAQLRHMALIEAGEPERVAPPEDLLAEPAIPIQPQGFIGGMDANRNPIASTNRFQLPPKRGTKRIGRFDVTTQ
jgi:hypothetical protein